MRNIFGGEYLKTPLREGRKIRIILSDELIGNQLKFRPAIESL
jgi:hypothetical protein